MLRHPGPRYRTLTAFAPLFALLAACSLEGTADVPGDVHAFDPIGSLSAVTAFAGSGAKLVRLEAKFVREDGTQDLEASYVGYVSSDTYDFARPTGSAVDPSVPVGARPTVAPFEGIAVTIQKPHWVSQSVNGQQPEQKKHKGMAVGPGGGGSMKVPAGPPVCSFKKLWAAARGHGAPAGAVAVITFDAKGYEFRIDGTPVHMQFDGQCALVP